MGQTLLHMEFILDGNQEIVTHIRSKLCYLITTRIPLSPKRPIFLHARATYSELPSDI